MVVKDNVEIIFKCIGHLKWTCFACARSWELCKTNSLSPCDTQSIKYITTVYENNNDSLQIMEQLNEVL